MLGALYIVRERKMDESKQWRTRNNKWTQVIIRYMKRTTHDIENTHVLNMFRRYSWIQSSYHRAHAYLQRRSRPRRTPTNVQQSFVCRAFSLCILSPTFDTRLANVRFKNNDGNYKTKKKGSNIRRVTIRNASNIWFMNDPLSDMIQKLYLWINMRLKCRYSCFLQFTRWCAIRCVFHRSTT